MESGSSSVQNKLQGTQNINEIAICQYNFRTNQQVILSADFHRLEDIHSQFVIKPIKLPSQ